MNKIKQARKALDALMYQNDFDATYYAHVTQGLDYAEELEKEAKDLRDYISGLTTDINGNIYPKINDLAAKK